jgi:hypothetical protein
MTAELGRLVRERGGPVVAMDQETGISSLYDEFFRGYGAEARAALAGMSQDDKNAAVAAVAGWGHDKVKPINDSRRDVGMEDSAQHPAQDPPRHRPKL